MIYNLLREEILCKVLYSHHLNFPLQQPYELGNIILEIWKLRLFKNRQVIIGRWNLEYLIPKSEHLTTIIIPSSETCKEFHIKYLICHGTNS